LIRVATDTGDPDERGWGLKTVEFLGGQREDGFEEVMFGMANFELRGVDTDRETAGFGGDVVAKKCALTTFVEMARSGEREGACGDSESGLE